MNSYLWRRATLVTHEWLHTPVALLVASIVCLTGCGEQRAYETTSLSGEVTLDGKPIERGTIAFVPANAGHGRGGNAPIVGGAYNLTDVPVGQNAFTFSASVETGKFVAGPGGQQEPERFNPIPSIYRTEGVVREIENGDTQDFELKSE